MACDPEELRHVPLFALLDDEETAILARQVASFSASRPCSSRRPIRQLQSRSRTLLNLFLSMLAALQAPVIMMSQNRQDTKDRVRSELDFDVNRRAESEIQGLARQLNLLTDKIGDVEDLIRGKAPASGD